MMTRTEHCGIHKLRNGKWAVGWYEYDETKCSGNSLRDYRYNDREYASYEAAVAGANALGFKEIKSRSFERRTTPNTLKCAIRDNSGNCATRRANRSKRGG